MYCREVECDGDVNEKLAKVSYKGGKFNATLVRQQLLLGERKTLGVS